MAYTMVMIYFWRAYRYLLHRSGATDTASC